MKRLRLSIAVQKAFAGPSVPAAADLRRWAEAAAGPGAAGELTIRIVGEPESAALNARYRGKTGPTNVLAFPGGPAEAVPEGDLPPLGDLVICAPVVEREALEQGKTLSAHWAHIVMHGTLHLVGYDHEDAPAARKMEARERALLAGFGFGDPYEITGA